MAAAVFVAVPGGAHASSSPVLPDLVPDNPERLRLEADFSAFPRLLLRFDAFIHNAGPGLLEIRGSAPDRSSGTPTMTRVVQRLYHGTTREARYDDVELDPLPRLKYQREWGHDHFHFFDPVTYYLVGVGESTSQLAFDKVTVGFCFVDSEPIEAPDDAVPMLDRVANRYCEEGNPAAEEVFMGLSPGWRDVYHGGLALQYIDVSNVRPGRYRVATVIDPLHHMLESDESNNRSTPAAEPQITIPGYTALSEAVSVRGPAPAPIQLRAARFESALPGAELPGPPEYLVTEPPSHGQLVHTRGETGWNDGSYAYLPDPGFTGEDRLTFAVRDSTHPQFPYEPSRATMRIVVGPLISW